MIGVLSTDFSLCLSSGKSG